MDDAFGFPGAGYDAAYGGMGMGMGMGMGPMGMGPMGMGPMGMGPMGMGMDDMEMDLPEEKPAQKVGEEREIGDNGLKKKLLREGEGSENPSSHDEVEGT